MTSVIRLLIVDDEPFVRSALTTILTSDPLVTVVGEAADGDEVVAVVEQSRPDVVLMDLRMERVHGPEATAAVCRLPDPPLVVAMTRFSTDEDIRSMFVAGAAGYLLKDAPRQQMITAIKTIAAGETALSPAVSRVLIERVKQENAVQRRDAARQTLALLTERERDVALAVHQCLSNEAIGRRLHISAATVKTHLASALVKVGVGAGEGNRMLLGYVVDRADLDAV